MYAETWEREYEDIRKHSVQVDTPFVERASLDYESNGVTLYWLSEDQADGERYENVAVDYDDLTDAFWGSNDQEERRASVVRDEIAARDAGLKQQHEKAREIRQAIEKRVREDGPRRPLSRRGRPMKHKWSELTAATVERCLHGPIPVQEDLVRGMLEWCVEQWGEEPALSLVRAYVAPIFQKFEGHWREIGPTGLAEKSGPEAERVMAVDFRHEG